MDNKRLIDIMREYDTADLINPDDVAYYDRLFKLSSPYGMVALVIADCLQDAIDEAVDAGKMKYFEIDSADLAEWDDDEINYLGNYGKPHIIHDLHAVELS